jgi:hypothetical protein
LIGKFKIGGVLALKGQNSQRVSFIAPQPSKSLPQHSLKVIQSY